MRETPHAAKAPCGGGGGTCPAPSRGEPQEKRRGKAQTGMEGGSGAAGRAGRRRGAVRPGHSRYSGGLCRRSREVSRCSLAGPGGAGPAPPPQGDRASRPRGARRAQGPCPSRRRYSQALGWDTRRDGLGRAGETLPSELGERRCRRCAPAAPRRLSPSRGGPAAPCQRPLPAQKKKKSHKPTCCSPAQASLHPPAPVGPPPRSPAPLTCGRL